MKLYNRAILHRREQHAKRHSTPDRDAVVWSVDTNNFYAMVKIQGSDTQIKVHYPRNYRVLPTWLKPGNAVRIRHRSGVQGYFEVVGHGRAIPTPVEGGSLPPSIASSDGIITGMEVVLHSSGGMNVVINSGTYRIDGETYAYVTTVSSYITMDDPAPMVMGGSIAMGLGGTLTPIAIDPPPSAGYGRYDGLFIGTDGVVDYTAGTAVSLGTEPAFPSVPTDHILIDYLFIYGGMTEVTASDIGARWSSPSANTVVGSSTIKTADGTYEMPWSAVIDTPTAAITLSITDQYGNAKSVGGDATVTLLTGTGGVGLVTYGSTYTASIGTAFTFNYQRNQLAVPELHPIVQVEFEGYPSLTFLIVIVLLDVSGDPI